MRGKSLSIEQVLTMLAYAPARLAELTGDVTPAQFRTRPNADDWSANDVLAHLRSCADVWGESIARILAEDGPTIRAINPTTWIQQTDHPVQEFRPSLAAFAAQRSELLAKLQPLTPEDWLREAMVTGAGAPLVRTVHDFAQRLVVHERSHLKQVERIVRSLDT